MHSQPEPGGGERHEELPRISGYLIEGVLGRGGSGVVYRARQRSVDRLVALKVLHPAATKRASTVKRLRREARLMAMLDHPNIVSAFDVGECADGWWLAMELVEGQALSDRLRRGGPLSEEEAIELFLPLSEALQHAHEAGVIHRDVKPANIILTSLGEARLVDLGLARSDEEPQLTRLGATMGTPHYVSPEQARNPADVDSRSDVYSLAATLHHVLCGRPPFPGQSQAEVLASVLHDPLSDPRTLHPGVSRGMSLVLRKALSKDPARRHASARELGIDLKLLLEGRRPRVQAGQLEPVEGKERSRSRYVLVLTSLAALGAFLALRGGEGTETPPPTEVVQTELQLLEESWRSGALSIGEAMAQHASVVSSAAEGADYERLGVELNRQLELVLSELRTKTDASRTSLLQERRFDEARAALEEGFDAVLKGAAGFTTTALPPARRSATTLWRERGMAEIGSALVAVHHEGGAELRRWCERELWPVVREDIRAREFASASEVLEADLSSYLERAGVRLVGLELDRLRESAGWTSTEETRQRLSYELDKVWRDLNEELLAEVQDAWEDAKERLETGSSLEVSEEFVVWARSHFLSAGLDLDEHPGEFVSKAVNAFEARVESLIEREAELSMQREFETLERLDEGSQALLHERRYTELLTWWGAEREVAEDSVKRFIELRMEEVRMLSDLLDDARAAVVAGVDGEVSLMEGGSKLKSAVRLDGDPLFERFWVSIAPGSERAWRLGGAPSVKEGVRRVSRVSLEGLAGRDAPCLEVAFLRLAEGDIQAAEACYLALGAEEAMTRLGDELALRLKPLLAAEFSEELRRKTQAERWVDTHELKLLLEGSPSKSLKMVEAFLRDYSGVLDAKRLRDVRSWRAFLEEVTAPATIEEFETTFGADETRFPGRGRVVLSQRFDTLDEGAWDAGAWIPVGLGWQAPRQAGIEEVITAKAPTLLLRDPFNLQAGPLEVVVEVEVPLDARARLVVVSAVGFHCAFVTGAGDVGRVVAGSRDLEGVIERAMGGEGEEFPGLRPGQSHQITMRANQARGTLTVLFDGEERVRIEDLSPKDRARSTSLSLRSLEPLLLIGVRIEAGRR